MSIYKPLLEDALGSFQLGDLPHSIKLPALPTAVIKFVEQAKDESVTLKQLARIVETDAGLTVELLRHVNSAYVGLRHKTNSVQQALALLGHRQATIYLVATGLQAAVRARSSKLINQTCFWNASLQKALFAREVAMLLHTDSDAAFAGSIIQDFLLPVITNHYLSDYLRFIEKRNELPATLVEYEHATFGWDHALVAAALAYKWHLPDELTCCLLYHHHGIDILSHETLKRSPVAAVAISALLPDQLRQHKSGLEQLHTLQSEWEDFDILALAGKVDEIQLENSLGVTNEFPLTRRCQPLMRFSEDTSDGILKLPSAAPEGGKIQSASA